MIVVVSLAMLFGGIKLASADELEEIAKKIEELSRAREMSETATRPLETQLSTLEKKLSDIEAGLSRVEGQIKEQEAKLVQLEKEISEGERDLAFQKDLFAKTVRIFYIRERTNYPLLIILAASNVSQVTRELAYQNAVATQDRDIILALSTEILELKNKKEEARQLKEKLAQERGKLAQLRAQVDREAEFFRKEVANAKKFQSDLSSQIAELTAKQQAIIGARSGTVITSVGEVPIGSDFNATPAFDPGFRPAFAVFSFGAYTHRNGMSQYGAKKQAESKNYRDIIQWYYDQGVRRDDGFPATISIQGYSDIDFQRYLYGIAEMPSDWPMEALKAQAVAARTFANRSNKPICITEACQVFLKSKSDNPPQKWKDAVDQTEKEIIDGNVSSQYSSTAGGYLNTSGWDTTDRSNSGNWTSRAWESLAGSPWFYKAWYRDGYRNDSPSCGRSHPWLTQEEFSDIVNAAIVLTNVSSDERVLPITINQCPVGGIGSGNPYSISEMRDRANQYGGAVTSIGSVTVSNNGSGQTTNVHLETNRGGVDIAGSTTFKSAFNLRAPGYISIPQSRFAFYNIERK